MGKQDFEPSKLSCTPDVDLSVLGHPAKLASEYVFGVSSAATLRMLATALASCLAKNLSKSNNTASGGHLVPRDSDNKIVLNMLN